MTLIAGESACCRAAGLPRRLRILLADRAGCSPIPARCILCGRSGQRFFGAGEVGLRAVEIGLIVADQLVKDIPGLDVRAFHKETL